MIERKVNPSQFYGTDMGAGGGGEFDPSCTRILLAQKPTKAKTIKAPRTARMRRTDDELPENGSCLGVTNPHNVQRQTCFRFAPINSEAIIKGTPKTAPMHVQQRKNPIAKMMIATAIINALDPEMLDRCMLPWHCRQRGTPTDAVAL